MYVNVPIQAKTKQLKQPVEKGDFMAFISDFFPPKNHDYNL